MVRARPSIPAVNGDSVRAALVVPVKSFASAKQRLADALDARTRAELAQWCAERVIAAAGSLVAHVVCDDDDVARWAHALGVAVIVADRSGLNAAVDHAVIEIGRLGFDVAVVAHGDLPLATRFDHVAMRGTVTVVPDHRYEGTNTLSVPIEAAERFVFQYGRGSFRRHVREAQRLGLAVRVLRDRDLAYDLDTPEDLDHPRMEDVRSWLRTNQASRR
jgi:2-phospho-L-lactate guanylyltransferase